MRQALNKREIQVSPFAGWSGNYHRIDVSAKIPTNQLEREWDGARLQTSITILGLAYDKNGVLVSRFSDTACAPSKSIEGYTVDDFVRDRLAISGISFCKRYRQVPAEPRAPTRAPQYISLVFDGQEFTPTGDTHFKISDPFMVYLEIHNSQFGTTAAPNLCLEMKVTDTKTGELRIGTRPRPV